MSAKLQAHHRVGFLRPGRALSRATASFVGRHQVVSFYVLTFAISWMGIVLVIGGTANYPGISDQIESRFLPVMLAWLAGPSVASIVITGLVAGRAGYRELLTRLTAWRVSWRWYGVALLMAPLVYVALCAVLSRISPDFVSGILVADDKSGLLAMGLAYGLLGGGFLEELGWTGFAVPRLRRTDDALGTGLIVGVLWGAYHFSVVFWAANPSPSGVLGYGILLAQLFAWLPACASTCGQRCARHLSSRPICQTRSPSIHRNRVKAFSRPSCREYAACNDGRPRAEMRVRSLVVSVAGLPPEGRPG